MTVNSKATSSQKFAITITSPRTAHVPHSANQTPATHPTHTQRYIRKLSAYEEEESGANDQEEGYDYELEDEVASSSLYSKSTSADESASDTSNNPSPTPFDSSSSSDPLPMSQALLTYQSFSPSEPTTSTTLSPDSASAGEDDSSGSSLAENAENMSKEKINLSAKALKHDTDTDSDSDRFAQGHSSLTSSSSSPGKDSGSTSASNLDSGVEWDSDSEGNTSNPRPLKRGSLKRSSLRRRSASGKHNFDARRTAKNRHEFTNVAHLSKMLVKIVKNYDIKSMVDIPCRNTMQFMPSLLHKLDFEVPGFKYYCVDTEMDSHDDLVPLYSDAGSPEFLHLNPATATLLPKTDLVFLWDAPQDWGVTTFWSFIMHMRQIRPSYLLVTNNQDAVNGERDDIINLRKQPFHVSSSSTTFYFLLNFVPGLVFSCDANHVYYVFCYILGRHPHWQQFNQATRVINNVWNGNTNKQLLFYEIKQVRRGF